MNDNGDAAKRPISATLADAKLALNEFGVVTEARTLRIRRVLRGPIERVWAYLVDPDKRALWLAGGKFDLRVGGKIRLEFDHACLSADKVPPAKYKDMGKPQFEGVITRLEPNRVLAYTWPFKSEASEVTFELEPREVKPTREPARPTRARIPRNRMLARFPRALCERGT